MNDCDRMNLTQLRAHAEMVDPIYKTPLTWVKIPPGDLLALIDAAEAAQQASSIPSGHDLLTNAVAKAMHYTMRAALARLP